MSEKKEVKLSRPIKLIYLTVVYSILTYILGLILGKIVVNEFSIHKLLLTITDKWFIAIYIMLYLLIPYINKVIQALNKKQFIILLTILITFLSIWPTLWSTITVKDAGYGIMNFIILYLIGAFIKRYCDDFNSATFGLILYIFSTIVTIIFKVSSQKAYWYNSIFVIIGAVGLFETFKAIKIKNNKMINKIGSFALTSYIIHENSFIIVTLYRNLFNESSYYNSPYLFLNLIYTTVGIYVFCIIIESIRRLAMKKLDEKIDNIKYKIKV